MPTGSKQDFGLCSGADMKLLEPLRIGAVEMRNRVVMPPMCMYQAKDGLVNDFHIAHYMTRSLGGVGLIIVEATGIEPSGQITPNDLGIWDDAHIEGAQSAG